MTTNALKKLVTTPSILILLFLSGCANTDILENSSDKAPIEHTDEIATNPDGPKIYVMFTLNVQEFMTPELSYETLNKVMDLHKKYDTPLDIYMASFIIQDYADMYPNIFNTLASDPMWAVSYHVRAPLPYAGSYNPYNWSDYTDAELYDLLLGYETYAMDWTTGELTDDPGAYSYLKELLGYAPIAASVKNTNDRAEKTLLQIYEDLGATFAVQHITGDGPISYGETSGNLLLRPENQEVRLFELSSDEAIDTIESYLEENPDLNEDIYFNIKMHDKDFFASDSAWTLIYARHKPPYKLPLYEESVEFFTQEERDAILEKYEAILKFVSEDDRFETINLLDLSNF